MQALYRKFRPQKFSELVGQEHVSTSLLKALETGKISHAFLFIGPRGTGKTSTARILAKSLNCQKYQDEKWGEPDNSCETCLAINDGRYLDLIEIDAASNRGIDEIRDLREKIKLAPTQGKFKIYIIDEVHMLTTEAFNALLKTLEEPPAHAKFVLCTTDPQKIPATVKSRCQVFEFRVPTKEELVAVLARTAKEEKKDISQEDLEKIAKMAKGAYRDALVLLEKYLVTEKLDNDFDLYELALSYYKGETKRTLEMSLQLISGGVNPRVLEEELVLWFRRVLLEKLGVDQSDSFIKEFTKQTEIENLKKIIGYLSLALEESKYSPVPSLPLELAIVANDNSLVKDSPVVTLSVSEESKPDPTGEPQEDKKQKTEAVEQEEKEVVKVRTGDTEVTVSTTRSSGLESIQSQWLELLRILRPMNHSLEALLRSSEPVDYKDGLLTLRFFYRFHKERVEDPKNKSLVEKVFQNETGLPIRLNLVLSDTPRPIKVREASRIETTNVKIVDDKDIPEAALDIFNS